MFWIAHEDWYTTKQNQPNSFRISWKNLVFYFSPFSSWEGIHLTIRFYSSKIIILSLVLIFFSLTFHFPISFQDPDKYKSTANSSKPYNTVKKKVEPSISFQTLENSICYCYTSYEMTDQFLSFQVQMNSYSSNWKAKAWLSQLVNFKNAIWHFRRTICNKIVF